MGTHRLGAILALVAALLVAPVGQGLAQTPPGVPGIQQVELSVDSSLRALQAWESLKKLGESLEGQDLNRVQALYAQQRYISAVQSHGFPDVQTWHRTLYTFLLSAGAIGQEAQFANLPPNLRATMAHLMPKPENIAVAKKALEKAEVARIYEQLR